MRSNFFATFLIFFLESKEKVVFLRPQSRVQAGIAQLVEHNLAKVRVASSSLVSRSTTKVVILFMLHALPSSPRWRGVFVEANNAAIFNYNQGHLLVFFYFLNQHTSSDNIFP